MSGLFKIIIVIAILLGLVLAGNFISNKYSENNQKPGANPPDGQLPISASERDEKEVKTLAENFVRIYKTYQLGDFSGLESLKDKMTARLWEEKANYIKEQKQKLENAPKRYLTYWAYPKDTTVLFPKDNEADVEVKHVQRELRGAIIQGPVTIEWVDENGQKNANITPTDSEKKAVLKIVKENGDWKVDTIEIK